VIVLVLGGTRSGKSQVAERIASEFGAPVTYLATARCEPGDIDFGGRIDAHRRRRPSAWRTVEEPHDLPRAIAAVEGTAMIDSLGTWLANASEFAADVSGLCDALAASPGNVVVVSEEVGLSLVPATGVARRFVDALGDCNAAVARVADRVLLVVAGRTLELGPD
jgi:adenosyl cobinamide kinase/adenosyl cobinamide phosphate guanylyltransferase